MTMCKRCLPARRKMRVEIDELENAKRCAEQNLAPFAHKIANRLVVEDVCIVGGAVRDSVLAAITGRNFYVKDWDVVCAKAPVIQDNKNILGVKENSFGGTKVELRDVGVVDIFQYYTNNPQVIIANTFDFNCNSLFYLDGKIYESMFFLHFIETAELFVCNPHKYKPAHIVARALKFQIVFKEQFGIDVKLNYRILHEIYSLTDTDKDQMLEYMRRHNWSIYNSVWQKFLDIRAH